jgi:predicted DNA binding CopG/RHH family protein
MKQKLIRTDLYITKIQYDEIKKKAAKKGITFSEMFRKILDWYLEEKI